MNLVVKFQQYFFLLVAFLLGSLAPLYGNVFNFVLLAFMMVLFGINGKEMLQNLRGVRWYIRINVAFLIYFSLHTLVVLLKDEPIAPPSFGTFEVLLLNFILVPMYVSTFKNWITPELLKRFLFFFCLGCVLLNIYIFFSLTGTQLFSAPADTLSWIYNMRFGVNRDVLGSKFWLEIQAMIIAIASLASYLLVISVKGWKMKVFCGFMFLMLVLFLSFTVTKSSILGFLTGFLILNVCLFRKFSLRMRYGLIAGLLVCVCGFSLLTDLAMYEKRIQEIEAEIQSVRSGEYRGATIVPRVAFIRESFRHLDEFSVWGLGVCTKHRIKAWYESSDLNIANYNNVNNAFLQYWITGGIFGLALVLFLFVAPVYRMIRRKKFSSLIFTMLIVFFTVSNTCVTLSWANSRLFMLLFLAMFCFYGDLFVRLEDFSEDKSVFDESSI